MRPERQAAYDQAKHLWENEESLKKYLTRLKELMYERRSNLQTNHPVELAIRNIVHEVEKLGASEGLTDAVIELEKARNSVADYIDHLEAIGKWKPQTPAQKEEPKDAVKFGEWIRDWDGTNTLQKWYDSLITTEQLFKIYQDDTATKHKRPL